MLEILTVLGLCMLLQAPLLAYNHFVEALFALNECRAALHASSGEASSSVAAPALPGAFSLAGAGAAMRAKRDTIYT
jgi:condensin-2 complex subunit D3